jgi:hypothetical protein
MDRWGVFTSDTRVWPYNSIKQYICTSVSSLLPYSISRKLQVYTLYLRRGGNPVQRVKSDGVYSAISLPENSTSESVSHRSHCNTYKHCILVVVYEETDRMGFGCSHCRTGSCSDRQINHLSLTPKTFNSI